MEQGGSQEFGMCRHMGDTKDCTSPDAPSSGDDDDDDGTKPTWLAPNAPHSLMGHDDSTVFVGRLTVLWLSSVTAFHRSVAVGAVLMRPHQDPHHP